MRAGRDEWSSWLPGGSAAFQVGLEIHHGADQVQQAEQAIAALQAGVTPQVCQQPQAPWCVPTLRRSDIRVAGRRARMADMQRCEIEMRAVASLPA